MIGPLTPNSNATPRHMPGIAAITSRMPSLMVRTFEFELRGRKKTTTESAKSNNKPLCWVINDAKPDECINNANGKIDTTVKEQKKEVLKQAKKDTKMWKGYLLWGGGAKKETKGRK